MHLWSRWGTANRAWAGDSFDLDLLLRSFTSPTFLDLELSQHLVMAMKVPMPSKMRSWMPVQQDSLPLPRKFSRGFRLR